MVRGRLRWRLLWLLPALGVGGGEGLAGEVMLVKAETLSLRERPSKSAKLVQTLYTYDPVELLGRDGEWARVKAVSSDKSGYVLDEYLSANAFVSVDIDQLNVRVGPGTQYGIRMKVSRNYPFRVVDRASSGWLRVLDFEGDQGWVSSKLVKFTPYIITTLEKSNVRDGAGENHQILFTAERGVLFKVLEENGGWLRVRHDDGDEGWISAKIVFGWLPVEVSKSSGG